MNVAPPQVQGIAATVHPFMMLQNRPQDDQWHAGNFLQQIIALDSMAFHDFHFIRQELSRLVQNFRRNLAFADIMHQSGKNQIPQVLSLHSHPFADHARQNRHIDGMFESIVIRMPDHQQMIHYARRIHQWIDLFIRQFLHPGHWYLAEQADRLEGGLDQIHRVLVIIVESGPVKRPGKCGGHFGFTLRDEDSNLSDPPLLQETDSIVRQDGSFPQDRFPVLGCHELGYNHPCLQLAQTIFFNLPVQHLP